MKLEEETTDPSWVESYARVTNGDKLRYSPEHPSARGEKLLTKVWKDILPELNERKVYEAPQDLPKDVAKWGVIPDWVALLDKFPHNYRNVFDWLDSWVPRGGHVFRNGAMTLKRVDAPLSRLKQYGQGINDPTPAFTFHGERLPYTETKEMLQKWVKQSRDSYPDAETYNLDVESLDDWEKVMGGRCSTYVFAESSILFHGMTPHQETHSPVPNEIWAEAFRESLDHEFPGYGPGAAALRPAHMFVGPATSGGVTLGNQEGAAGYPYLNMSPTEIQDAFKRPKFKGRVTKGVAHQHAFKQLVKWIKGGMRMNGELYEAVSQPATLGYRGDRAVHLGIRALASRGQDSSKHNSAMRLAAMLPSRSIIIVPTVLVLAQSMWAQPIGNHIAGSAAPGFDWVDPGHSVKRLDEIRQLDLQSKGLDSPVATVGADASGWDRDVVGQFHAGEAAWYMSMFEKEQTLLYVDAQLPIDVSEQWVADRVGSLSAGGTETSRVSAILPDGSITTTTAKAEVVTFDFWEFITKVMTMVNDAPIRWADYEIDAPGVIYDMGLYNEAFEGYKIVSNGGRRSGDAATGIGNSWTNTMVTRSAPKMRNDSKYADMVKRRAALQGNEPGPAYEVYDYFSRGDDLAMAIKLPKGGVPSVAVASGISSVGMRANAKKQEASDIPGKPVFGFANVLVTENYMGKLVGRTAQRYMVQESRGLNLEMLNAVKETGNDTALSDALIATTGTAKARIAPMAGFPLMDEHPLTPKLVEWAVHNDKYRLAYVTDNSFDDKGRITDEARAEIERAAQVEARAQAKLRARRENVSVDLERIQEAYAGSTVHDHILDYALVEDYKPTKAMTPVDNHTAFKEAVRLDEPLRL